MTFVCCTSLIAMVLLLDQLGDKRVWASCRPHMGWIMSKTEGKVSTCMTVT